MKILVADDEPVTLRLLERLLTSWGHTVVAVHDGNAAAECLAKDGSFQTLLLDWNMPGRTGLEVCKFLRHRAIQRYTYVILLTGNTGQDCLLDAYDAGVDDYLVKPINNNELKARLKAAERITETQEQLFVVHETLREQQQSLEDLNRNLDRRVQEQTEELRTAVAVAERASAMKSMFLANMSHEIRTPINGIVSYVELLLDSKLDEEQRSDLNTIQNCVQTLRGLINNVLDFSKIESGMMLLEEASFNPRATIHKVIRMFEASITSAALELILEIDESIPDKVIGDQGRLSQILTNLIANSIKFTEKGGYIVVQARTTPTADTILFSVTDTGHGVSTDKQESIFESFAQEDSSTTRKFGGTGLGLTICRKLSTLMQGTIVCRSHQGVGSCFVLTIRLPEAMGQTNVTVMGTAPDTSVERHRRISQHPASILLAEDDIANQHAMVRLLTGMGHRVIATTTGKEVLEKLREEVKFDLVLMDVQMPELSGEDATIAIRQGKAGDPNIPIVVLSANVMVTERERYKAIGAHGVLGKPIDLNLLYQEIEKQVTKNQETHNDR